MGGGCVDPACRLDALAEFCADVFADLLRADQRRWATTFVQGLVTLEGRKTISRIAAALPGPPAEQNLQQFVNQSPWSWTAVRRRLAQIVDASLQTHAWVVGEVVLPRNGTQSVGVGKQSSFDAQRTVNGQLALAAFLAGGRESVPVGWRLHLPDDWRADSPRRRRAGVPDDERGDSRTGLMLALVDELAADATLPTAPVVYDARAGDDLLAAVAGLEARGHHYLVRLDDHAPLSSLPQAYGAVTVLDYVRRAAHLGEAMHRQACGAASRPAAPSAGGPKRSNVLTVPAPRNRDVPNTEPAPVRHLAASWYPHDRRPRGVWLTDLPAPWLRLAPGLMSAGARLRGIVRSLASESGLFDWEGRSYRGWHHHTTLVSVAHAFRILERVTPAATFW